MLIQILRSRFALWTAAVFLAGHSLTVDAAVGIWGVPGATIDVLTTIPLDLTNIQAIAAGRRHCLALRTDGTVVGWGNSTYGQATVPFGLSGVTHIAAGGYHSLARKSDGSVIAWGANRPAFPAENNYGQATIPGGLSSVVRVAAGGLHSLVLKSDGTVVAWGWNAWAGTTGIGPTNVPPGLNSVTAIAAGYAFSMALKADGTVVMWGQVPGGPVNVTVPSSLNGVVAISAGTSHALALKNDGTVFSWGWTDSASNVNLTNVPPGLSGIVAIDAGHDHSLALKADGTVVSWGSIYTSVIPETVVGVTHIAAGESYSLASGPEVAITPQIAKHPLNQTIAQGSTVSFNVLAQGGAPRLYFQWRFNGIPLAAETNAIITISNAQPTHAGNYSVLVSNLVGIAISQTAKLTIQASNDSFESPLEIPSVGGRTFSSNTAATKESLEPNHAGNIGGRSIWFSWLAPNDGMTTVDTIGSTFDTLLAVYTGPALETLSLVAADDDGAGYQLNSKLAFPAVQGTFYHIAVDGYNSGQTPAESGGVILNLYTEQPVIATPIISLQGAFKFQIGGHVGSQLVVEASEDLIFWTPVSTIRIPESGIITFIDNEAKNFAARFFRVSIPGR